MQKMSLPYSYTTTSSNAEGDKAVSQEWGHPSVKCCNYNIVDVMPPCVHKGFALAMLC